MLVVCLLNPQRGVSGSPFINNMTSDLLIRPFNLKFYKTNNILLVSTGKSYCSSKAFVMFVSLSCKATEEFGIILSGMVKLTATPFPFQLVWSLINVWSEEDESNACIIKFSTSPFLPHEYRVKAHWFVLMSSYTVNLNLSKCTCRKMMDGLLTLEKVLADINILLFSWSSSSKKK